MRDFTIYFINKTVNHNMDCDWLKVLSEVITFSFQKKRYVATDCKIQDLVFG